MEKKMETGVTCVLSSSYQQNSDYFPQGPVYKSYVVP